MDFRIEKDTMGEIMVPTDSLWGAQTQRSLQNFRIGDVKMPKEIISAFASLKKACALVNGKTGRITEEKTNLIDAVCDEILSGELSDNFPLSVFQTGSGTQTNMNVNEVIANRGNQIAGKKILHPNDDVNACQSSNDTFPTAMNIAALCVIEKNLFPAVDKLINAFITI